MRSSVVLPAPLAPSRATVSLRASEKLTPNSTRTCPYPAERLRTCSIGDARDRDFTAESLPHPAGSVPNSERVAVREDSPTA